MARIVWSHIEKGAIFARMEQVFRQRPNLTRKEALREAQTVLNASRWIKVTDQRVFNYKDRIEVARQKAQQESKKTPPKAVEAPAPILAPTPAPERKETPKTRLADILELLLDVVAESVAARVADKMSTQMLENAPQIVVNRPKHNPQPIPHPTGYARPGVLVIGLLPAQAHAVANKYHDRLDLSFFTPEQAVTYDKLTRAHTVLMTKFINHAVQDKYRKAPKLHFCNGGVDSLHGILDRIVAPVL
jgi:hypothetical protein